MEPSLDDEALARLRTAVRELDRHQGGAVPHEGVVALAESLGSGLRITLDLRASELLGAPMLIAFRKSDEEPLPELSSREREVVALIAEGLTNKGIAHRLALSPATVKDHVHHILQKTGLPNRAAIVARRSY